MIGDFAATSSACIMANLVTHPLEVLKIRQQAHSGGRAPNMVSLTAQIARNEGIKTFYRGLEAGLYRAVVSGGGRLTVYNQLKLWCGSDLLERGGMPLRVALGITAGGTAAVAAVPFDLIRTRQLSMKGSAHQSTFQVCARIVREEGGILALWSGSSATFLRQAIFTAAQLASYDQSKSAVVSLTGAAPDSTSVHFAASLVSGVVTTLATAPIEMIKTQVQTSIGGGGSILSTAQVVLQRGGVRAFWRGSGAIYCRVGPHTALVLVGIEWFRRLFGVASV